MSGRPSRSRREWRLPEGWAYTPPILGYVQQYTLEYVRRRRDAFHAQVHFRLSAMVRGMREVRPKPFEAGHIARADFIHQGGRHGSNGFVAEVEGVLEERDRG